MKIWRNDIEILAYCSDNSRLLGLKIVAKRYENFGLCMREIVVDDFWEGGETDSIVWLTDARNLWLKDFRIVVRQCN